MVIRKQLILLTVLLLAAAPLWAQGNAEIQIDEPLYDFGIIAEADGLADHTFVVKNTGTLPLVITRVTASCGCTRPDWTRSPIEPGRTGEVTISYNPKGRPGPFYKSVAISSNAKTNRALLHVKGSVTPRSAVPPQPAVVYPYSIGTLKLQTKTILYTHVRPGETPEEKILVKNESENPLTIRLGKTPHYLTATVTPASLDPGDSGEIHILFNTDKAKRMGRVSTNLPVEIETAEKKKPTEGNISVAANVIDNFSGLSASEKAKAPVIEFSSTLLEFGKLPEKSGGILPFIGKSGKESESFTITNTGKSVLSIYSVTCDNAVVDISGGRRELKPGAKAEYKVTIRTKEVKAKLEAFINVVCNDPNGPVRLIKVTAEK